MSVRAKNEVRFCEKLTEIYIYFVIIAFSLFCFPDYGSITEWKFKIFFWSALAYAVLLLLGNLELYLVGSRTDLFVGLRRGRRAALIALGGYLLLCVLSFAFSEHKAESLIGGGKFDGLISLILYVFVFASVLCFGRFKISYALAFIPVVILNFILVILQFFGANPFGLYPSGMSYHDAFRLYANEFLGTFGNVDILSAFLSIAVPLFIAVSVFGEVKHKNLFIASLFPAAFCLFICKVYSGMVGTAAAILLLAFFIKSNDEFRGFIRALAVMTVSAASALYLLDLIPLMLLVLILIISVAAFFIKSFHRKIFLVIFCTAFVLAALLFTVFLLKNENSDSGRLRIWADALRIFSESPLLGSGPGTFLNEVSFGFERFSEELGITITSNIDAAHNIYLHILACTGIFSLLAFITFIIFLIKDSRRSVLLFPIASFLVCSFFSFEVCSVSAIFYIICGLAVCDTTIKQ